MTTNAQQITEFRDVADRLAIREVMDRYALAIDHCDWDIYRDVFSTDAVIDYSDSGGMRAGREATIEWLDAALSMFAGLHHNMTSHVCEIDGDAARAVTYFIAYQTMADGSGGERMMSIGGFYQDRLVRQDRWRIAERVEYGIWLEGSWPDGFERPRWYGKAEHHKPALPA